jgi:hypothetical protein
MTFRAPAQTNEIEDDVIALDDEDIIEILPLPKASGMYRRVDAEAVAAAKTAEKRGLLRRLVG